MSKDKPRKIMIIERCHQCPFHKIYDGDWGSDRKLYCLCTNHQVQQQDRDGGLYTRGSHYPIVCDYPHGNARPRADCDPFPAWCPLQSFNPIRGDGFWGVMTVAPDDAWLKSSVEWTRDKLKRSATRTLESYGKAIRAEGP